MNWKLFLLAISAPLALILLSHLSVYSYGYEPLGTESRYGSQRFIVSVNRNTGDACIWEPVWGWICVDADTYARAKRIGTVALPSKPLYMPPYGAP